MLTALTSLMFRRNSLFMLLLLLTEFLLYSLAWTEETSEQHSYMWFEDI